MKKLSLIASICAIFFLFGCALSPVSEKTQVTAAEDTAMDTLAVDPIFGIYSETQPIKISWDSDAKLDIWTDSGAGMTLSEVTSTYGEGVKCWRLKGTGTWMGMAVRVEPLTNLKDMSGYGNAGSLNFMYKGSKLLKVGIKSGGTTPVEKWLSMTNGAYGFNTNNTWCTVVIPASVFSGVNFGSIEQYFMLVADSGFGYTAGSTYRIDNIYWGRP